MCWHERPIAVMEKARQAADYKPRNQLCQVKRAPTIRLQLEQSSLILKKIYGEMCPASARPDEAYICKKLMANTCVWVATCVALRRHWNTRSATHWIKKHFVSPWCNLPSWQKVHSYRKETKKKKTKAYEHTRRALTALTCHNMPEKNQENHPEHDVGVKTRISGRQPGEGKG